VGTVLPFAFDPSLELIVDIGVRDRAELFFNAARLDRSVALRPGRLHQDGRAAVREYRNICLV
jgi:prolyl-tRNA editing enzyme YbaK/EbsC (Cys-tRNA(Pro) deacylase)